MDDGEDIVYLYRDDRTAIRHVTGDDLVDHCYPTGYFARGLRIDASALINGYNVPVVVLLPELAKKEGVPV